MAMLLESLLNFAPRVVELDGTIETATRFVRMRAGDLRPVKPAGVVQHFQMIDGANPKRGILPVASGVKHLVWHPDRFQQPDYLRGASEAFSVPASYEIKH